MSLLGRAKRGAAVSLSALLLAACGGQMRPAEELIGAVQATVDLSSAAAQAYVPDRLADVRSRLNALRVQFAEKHYGAVVAEAPAVLARAQGLAAAAATKKGEVLKAYQANWAKFADSVPVSFDALQTRIAVLGRQKMGRHAAGIDLAGAEAGLVDARLLWSKAQAAFVAGNLEEAVSAARDAGGKAAASAALLSAQQSRAPAEREPVSGY